MASPNISAAVAVETKNPPEAPATSNLSKSISGGKILNVSDMQGNGLR